MELKVVTFVLNDQVFGVDIMKVESIVEPEKIRPIPESSDFIEGVMNLRGKIIPVVNLKKKFKMPDIRSEKAKPKIIVADVKSTLAGFLVDDVSEVITITEREMEEVPRNVGGIGKNYILGLAKVKGDILVILNIEEVLSSDEKVELEKIKNSV